MLKEYDLVDGETPDFEPDTYELTVDGFYLEVGFVQLMQAIGNADVPRNKSDIARDMARFYWQHHRLPDDMNPDTLPPAAQHWLEEVRSDD